MAKEELYDKLEGAYQEITELIDQSTERGQFNRNYFRSPFIRWFVKKLEERDKVTER